MVNQPNQDTQGLPEPSGRLVLPAPPDEGQYLQPYTIPIRPEQLIRRPAPSDTSHGLFTRMTNTWRRDPAYWILSLAIVLVVIASIVFVALGASAFLSPNNNNNSPSVQTSAQPSPTPTLVPTPSAQPTPSNTLSGLPGAVPTLEVLSVQIVSVPATVVNNTKVRVIVQANESGVTVSLQVTYNAAPFIYNSSSHTTNTNDTSTISWPVRVLAFHGAKVQATLVVTAKDKNGQTATSQLVSVTVNA